MQLGRKPLRGLAFPGELATRRPRPAFLARPPVRNDALARAGEVFRGARATAARSLARPSFYWRWDLMFYWRARPKS